MGLDITVMIVDWSWLENMPPEARQPQLRDAWYADETGLWDHYGPAGDGDWAWLRGLNSDHFGVYEFRSTSGSFKAHFWAGQRWESVRDHADPLVRADLDTVLLGLIWRGPNGAAEQAPES